MKEEKAAVITERGDTVTYAELFEKIQWCANVMDEEIQREDGKPLGSCPERCLVLLLCNNSLENLVIYLACLWRKMPVILLGEQDRCKIGDLTETFPVAFLWIPEKDGRTAGTSCCRFGDYVLSFDRSKNAAAVDICQELALLLPTSGSEGGSKLVMLTYDNILENTRSITEALEIQREDRAAVMLPLCYSYGLSVVHTHLFAGASLLMPDSSMVSPQFWRFLEREHVTSLAGVPSAYELMRKLRILEGTYDFSRLRILTQAGGALRLETQRYILEQLKKMDGTIHFAVMYGQTEATARMSSFFLEEHGEHIGSVGRVIPGGKLWIEGDTAEGEICYQGKNVFTGYARGMEDLSRVSICDRILHTGDIGYLDEEGYLYVTGRKKRFAKVNGYRIGLDGLQAEISQKLGCETVCVSVWKQGREQIVFCMRDKSVDKKEAEKLLCENRKIAGSFFVETVEEFSYKENGKIDYGFLQRRFAGKN